MRQIDPATVIASLALFVSLSGGAYAAATISGAEVKNGTLTSLDVKDRSLLAKDFKAGQLPAGPQGAPGQPGAKGEPGPKGDAGADGKDGATSVVVRRADIVLPGGKHTVGHADCEPGERVTGGGVHTGSTQAFATSSVPSSDKGWNFSAAGTTPNSWRVQIQNSGGYTNGEIFVICATP